ncbi:FadR/GntR family transcriptional regulator [Aquabacter cavernae]|uniref:FadR/GntR family transcriptional regulator n=1 Tax=Aquabacter cavernae TaxID=2496029 RepID=UPI0013E0A03C|nr:FadR/GntR family transcriptional regulator [Aquabacter cavernae]
MALRKVKALEKVARTTLVDEVITAIRGMLDEEGWTPGSRLPSEHELSVQLGVGRSTVREALRVLGHLGLVQSRSGLGTFVVGRDLMGRKSASVGEAEALVAFFEFRRALEPAAARLAAQNRTPESLAAIETAWQTCYAAAQNSSVEEFTALDHSFHLSIFEASDNPFLIEAYRAARPDFIKYVGMVLALGPLTRMMHFHDNLIQAIRDRDPAAAVDAVEENFVDTDVRQKMMAETPPKAPSA